jgi:hypothetical protein
MATYYNPTSSTWANNRYRTTLILEFGTPNTSTRTVTATATFQLTAKAGSGFAGYTLNGHLKLNGVNFWTPSGQYSVNASQSTSDVTVTLASASITLDYPDNADQPSFAVESYVQTVNQTITFRVPPMYLDATESAPFIGAKLLPPGAPTNVSATTTRTDGIRISWTAATGTVSSYGLHKGSAPSGSTVPFANTSSTAYLDTKALVGDTRYWVRAQNSAGSSAWAPVNGVLGTRLVAPSFTDLTVTTNWRVGSNYSEAADKTVAASNATSYSILASSPTANTFPSWLQIDASGQLSGTPTAAGTYTFRIRASGPGGNTDSANISIVVYSVVTWVTTSPLTPGITGIAYSNTLVASNATNNYSISPAFNLSTSGLSFNAISGTIGGTPKEITTYSFTVTASNPGSSASRAFTLKVDSGGDRMLNGAPVNLTIKRRYNAATNEWIPITHAKRWDATARIWRDISN